MKSVHVARRPVVNNSRAPEKDAEKSPDLEQFYRTSPIDVEGTVRRGQICRCDSGL